MAARSTPDRERELYELGRRLLERDAGLPPLSPTDTAHLLRGLWDRAGFIGPNDGGYPVVSVVAPAPLAHGIAGVIERVTGRRCPARPLGGALWVGVSGRWCLPWLEYLYGGARVASETKLRQVALLLGGR